MFKKKIPVGKDLYERASQYAREKGYSDLSEWVSDLMEEEMKRPGTGGTGTSEREEEIKKKLQGLGYIS